MIHNNICKRNSTVRSICSVMNRVLMADGLLTTGNNKSFIHSTKTVAMKGQFPSIRHLHIAKKQSTNSLSSLNSLSTTTRFTFSTSANQQTSFNDFRTIRQLNNLPTSQNKFHSTSIPFSSLPSKYSTVSLDLQKKLQKVEAILHSPEKNLYKIVEEIVVVLEAFAQVNRRDVLEENVVKVVKEFGNKIVSAYLESLQVKELQELQRENSTRKSSQQASEFLDTTYSLRQNYTSPPPESEFPSIPTFSNTIDLNFILFYIQTLKSWLLANVETDSVIRQAQEEIFKVLNAREVSALSDTLKAAVKDLLVNYIEEGSMKKRDMFPFELKLRGICLLPFFESKTQVEKYLQRLSEQNLAIYLKESQIITAMWDIAQLQPDLSHSTQFIYQIQSTRIYQNLSSLNGTYIKALFITYTRKFMVSYHEIQFYELFRDMQPKLKYPTIRTFIRLCNIINTQAADLHCEYNKVMNKYNYNIIISIIISQNYSVENTKFDEFLELFESINLVEQCGEILYEEMAKFIKAYWIKNLFNLTQAEIDKVYRIFKHVLSQAQPVFRYEDKEGLNREFGRKTTLLLSVLFDILIEKHPHVIIIGSKFIKSWLIVEDNVMSSVALVPHDDRDIKIEMGGSPNIIAKIEKVKSAYTKLLQDAQQLPAYGKHQSIPFTLREFLQTTNSFLKTSIQWTKKESPSEQQPNPQPITKSPSDFNLLGNIYPIPQSSSFQLTFIKQLIEPIIKQYLELANKDLIKKLSTKEFVELYRNLFNVISALNSIECTKDTADMVGNYVEHLRRKVLYEMKFCLDEKDKIDEAERTTGIEHLNMSVPKGNIELLLCLSEIINVSNKLHSFTQITKTEQHLSSTSTLAQPASIQSLTLSLPLIYNFINRLAIKNFKAIEEPDIINIIFFVKGLEEIKASQKQNVLLLEISPLVWEYLYQSLSVYLMYMSDKGKFYLKMTNYNTEHFATVISHFVSNKVVFRSLRQKKRLVVLQSILVGLIRRKHFKISMSHLKRSEHARIFLSFLQIFEYPQNLTMDFKKILEETEFLQTDLEEIPTEILERFSDANWTIARYLDDINVNLTSSKKLSKLSIEELRKEFEERKSSKIYEMILRNSKFSLPFMLPEPKTDDKNAKLAYIIQKIYQKISKRNNYLVRKASKGSKNGKQTSKMQEQESVEIQEPIVSEEVQKTEQLLAQQQIQKFNQNFDSRGFLQVNLSQEKQYIMKESLVNYTYEDHYKIKDNKLPLHFKKENWKNLYAVPKELEIQSLETDEKIDQNIYKQVMLALLGYVEKVKMVATQFHAHSFIQYIAAQLDMEVFYHGCIARISRKNKPEENILIVCALETNYKLLYICTHILRESGENAYISLDKIKDSDFRDFLQKLLPQPFEVQETQIVEKVVKGDNGLEGEENTLIREHN